MSLLAPLYLAGIFAIAVPVLLHRLHKDEPPLKKFASEMFLQAAEVTSSRSKKLRYLFLFCTRLALIVILSLLFAQPIFDSLSSWADRESRLHLLIIDASLSMRHSDRWSQAIDAAERQISGLPAADKAQLFTADQNLTEIDVPSNDKVKLRELLSALTPGLGRLDYGKMISSVNSYTKDIDSPVSLHFFTDGQASGQSMHFAEMIPQSAADLRITAVGASTDKNISLRAKGRILVNGLGEVKLQIMGLQDPVEDSIDASLYNNGKLLSTISLDSVSKANHMAEFTDVTLADGVNRLTVRINASDELNEDNEFHITLNTGHKDVVYFLGLHADARSEFYLRNALSVDPRYILKNHDRNANIVKDDATLIAISDAATLTDSEMQAMMQYLERGGKAMIVTGNRLDGRSAELLSLSDKPGTESQTVDSDRALSLMAKGGTISHPLTLNSAAWSDVRVFRYLAVESQSRDRVIIQLSNSSPFIFEREFGKGHAVIIASSLNAEENEFPLSTLFAPFIADTAAYLTGSLENGGLSYSGDTLAIDANSQLISPAGRRLVRLSETARSHRVKLSEAGHYSLHRPDGIQVFAVNTHPEESSMQALDKDRIELWQSRSDRRTETVRESSETALSRKVSLWPWLLSILVLIVAFEALFSHRYLHIRRGVVR